MLGTCFEFCSIQHKKGRSIRIRIETYYKEELIESYKIIDNGRGGIDFEYHPEDDYIIEVEYEFKEVA